MAYAHALFAELPPAALASVRNAFTPSKFVKYVLDPPPQLKNFFAMLYESLPEEQPSTTPLLFSFDDFPSSLGDQAELPETGVSNIEQSYHTPECKDRQQRSMRRYDVQRQWLLRQLLDSKGIFRLLFEQRAFNVHAFLQEPMPEILERCAEWNTHMQACVPPALACDCDERRLRELRDYLQAA